MLTEGAGIFHGKGHVTLAHNLTTLTNAMDFYEAFKVFLEKIYIYFLCVALLERQGKREKDKYVKKQYSYHIHI